MCVCVCWGCMKYTKKSYSSFLCYLIPKSIGAPATTVSMWTQLFVENSFLKTPQTWFTTGSGNCGRERGEVPSPPLCLDSVTCAALIHICVYVSVCKDMCNCVGVCLPTCNVLRWCLKDAVLVPLRCLWRGKRCSLRTTNLWSDSTKRSSSGSAGQDLRGKKRKCVLTGWNLPTLLYWRIWENTVKVEEFTAV